MNDWRDHAACKGLTSLMYPADGEWSRDAKRVCTACVVRQPCLDYALDNGERFGVWGGADIRDRRVIVRRGRAA